MSSPKRSRIASVPEMVEVAIVQSAASLAKRQPDEASNRGPNHTREYDRLDPANQTAPDNG